MTPEEILELWEELERTMPERSEQDRVYLMLRLYGVRAADLLTALEVKTP